VTEHIKDILAAHPPVPAATLRPNPPAPAREPWQDNQAELLDWVGFDNPKYQAVDRTHGFVEDHRAEAKLQEFIADLLRHIAEGAWLYLLGGKGVGKTMAMARIVLAAPLHPNPAPAGKVHPLYVSYRFAPDVGYAFADLAVSGEPSAAIDVAMSQRIYMIDDIHRWMLVGGYVRDNILAGWDAYTEKRDGKYLTVVSANLTEAQMDAVPQFKLGLDRARERGLILEIRGESERGQQKTD